MIKNISQQNIATAVLMTCYNRCEKTLKCIASLAEQVMPEGYSFEIFLTDDASSDGTSNLIKKHFPEVKIIQGDGNRFWNGGMNLAFEKALKGNYTYFLWLNDDLILYKDSVYRMIETNIQVSEQRGGNVICVGTVRDPFMLKTTYGGLVRPFKVKKLKFELLDPDDKPRECETMNGNCVLIPLEIAKTIGNLDPVFTHSMGDLDYGLKAHNAGYPIIIMPGYAGTCARNPTNGTFVDKKLPLRLRLNKIFSAKGLPPSEWMIFCKRHGGPLWYLYCLKPYFDVIYSSIISMLFECRGRSNK